MMRKIDVECTFILHYYSLLYCFILDIKNCISLLKLDQIMLKGPTCTHDLSSKSLSLFLGVGIIIDSSKYEYQLLS